MSIDILMATFNGEKYVAEQIRSLFSQTYNNFRLIIGDDASSDKTPDIISSFVQKYPDRILFLPFTSRLGACGNYSRLIELSDADYLMFCDQDDVWMPKKIEYSLACMKELESIHGTSVPLMVHSDLIVVDQTLKPIHPSWRKYVGVSQHSYSLNALLLRHAYLGCTLLCNKELILLSSPIPPEAGMHDYWITLTATALGHIGNIEEPTIYYRIHDCNVVGAHAYDYGWLMEQIRNNPDFIIQTKQRILRSFSRAFIFYNRYKEILDPKDLLTLEQFLTLKYEPFYKELFHRFRYGFFEQTFWQNLALLYSSKKMGRFMGK